MAQTLPWSWTSDTTLREVATDRAQMRDSEPIEVDGRFVGVAVTHRLGVRFIAVNDRVGDMHQSVWPTLDYARRAARQLFRSKSLANSF
jgi:hypothetical protein